MTEGQATTPPCVIVLGMHRSGTSVVTGSLEAAGLYLGDVNNAATYNRKGNKENVAIRDLNNRLLARVGASWKTPPTHQVEWSGEDLDCAKSLVEPYLQSRRPWGFKDPRTIWTLEGWLRLLPEARSLGVFRHPSSVVRSLSARPGSLFVEAGDALQLWCAYNAEMLRLQQKYHFQLLHFTPGSMSFPSFTAQLIQFRRNLGLTGDPSRFYRDELVTHTQSEPVGDFQAMAIYSRLFAVWTRQAEPVNDIETAPKCS